MDKDDLLQRDLMGLNCAYNHNPVKGRCYSNTCSMNLLPDIAERIHNEGCVIWSKMPEAIEEIHRKTKGDN